MKTTSHTTNPLHFEDLEPHRFEDLVRQLAYDFRTWRSLEATGRSGSDEGFDVRGWQTADSDVGVDSNGDDSETADQEDSTELDRLWLIQCKRERYINPSKLAKYAKQITDTSLYGVVFVAACDFSKKARDLFLATLRGKGIQEVHIWGKAELEDMLFQPKNDHLLFAYFGISLLIRHRSLRTQIRSKLATKRKCINVLGELRRPHYKPVLLRDANGSCYPDKEKGGHLSPSWSHASFIEHYSDGIICKVREHFAYLGEDKQQWDYVKQFNELSYLPHNTWLTDEERKKQWEERAPIFKFWQTIPETQRAWLEICWMIPYEEIVAVDPDGDRLVSNPHIYFPFNGNLKMTVEVKVNNEVILYFPEQSQRVEFFPNKFPKIVPQPTPGSPTEIKPD